MKTLKEKWTEALPVFASVLCAIGIIFLIVFGISILFRSDSRNVEEIKNDRYKSCIKYADIQNYHYCVDYLN